MFTKGNFLKGYLLDGTYTASMFVAYQKVQITTCKLLLLALCLSMGVVTGLGRPLEGDSSESRFKFIFNFDTRHSFITSRNVRIGGIRIGLQDRNRRRFGLGLYVLDSYFPRKFRVQEGTSEERVVEAQLDFAYFGLYYEPIIYDSTRWEFSVPVVLGLGGSGYVYDGPNGEQKTFKEGNVVLLEASVMGEYKFLKWLGVGAGMGYRQMLKSNPFISEDLNTPIYILKLKLFPVAIYKMIFKPGQKD